ncbi:MAG: GtrA family protein [Eubacteriales bacterium]
MKKRVIEWFTKFKKDIIQFFKFQFVSVISYWSDYSVYAMMYGLVFAARDPVMGAIYAKIISYPVGLMVSYLINKRWTFGVRRKIFSMYLLKFIIVNACALTANLLAIYILTKYYNISPYISSMMATVFSFCINYSGNKVWVFE